MSIWNVLLFPYLVFRLFELPLALFDYSTESPGPFSRARGAENGTETGDCWVIWQQPNRFPRRVVEEGLGAGPVAGITEVQPFSVKLSPVGDGTIQTAAGSWRELWLAAGTRGREDMGMWGQGDAGT